MNNNREWFQANKPRYENDVRDALVGFVADFGDRLREISPHMVADPRPSGGSVFRIYRDVRFSKKQEPVQDQRGRPLPSRGRAQGPRARVLSPRRARQRIRRGGYLDARLGDARKGTRRDSRGSRDVGAHRQRRALQGSSTRSKAIRSSALLRGSTRTIRSSRT